MATKSTATVSAIQNKQSKPPLKSVKAVLLSQLVENKFGGDYLAFSKVSGVPTSQLKRWAENSAVIVDKEVFIQASRIETDAKVHMKAFDFNDYLNSHYGGNRSRFAEANDILQQQVSRWTQTKCMFMNGQVYRLTTRGELNSVSAPKQKAKVEKTVH